MNSSNEVTSKDTKYPPAYISKEDAVKIALETRTSCEIDWHVFDDEDFHRALNLAIAKVIGEPVKYLITDKATGVQIHITGDKLVANAYMVAHKENELTPLYAINELPND